MANDEKQVKLVVKKAVHLIVRLLVAVSDFKLYTQRTIINIFKSQTTHNNTIHFKVHLSVSPTGIIKTPKIDVIFQFSAKFSDNFLT